VRPTFLAALIAASLVGPAASAPAPLPRRAELSEVEALWKQAQAELQAAHQMRKEINEKADELGPSQYIATGRKSRDLIRQAAEKFTRIAESRSPSTGRRELAALAGASAWMQVSEYRRAAALYEVVLSITDVPASRDTALEGAIRCYRYLNQSDDLKRVREWGRK
jgi:hypothetical protein